MPPSTIILPQHLQLDGVHSSSSRCTDASSSSSSLTPSHSTAEPYLIDNLHHMLTQEKQHYAISHDYLSHSWVKVTPTDRKTMCTWSYDIVDACNIGREVATVAMGYLDRYMCTAFATTNPSTVSNGGSRATSSSPNRAEKALASRREFQLAFITCLIIALKCRAGMQVDSDFVSDTICQGLYNPEEIVDMEREVLAALQWRLNGPSPHEFIGGLLELLPPSVCDEVKEGLKKSAGRQVESASCHYTMGIRSSSSIAHAALMSAMSDVSSSDFHPVDCMVWLNFIEVATGLRSSSSSKDCGHHHHQASPPTTSPLSCGFEGDTVATMCTPTRDGHFSSSSRSNRDGYTSPSLEGYDYCTPVSSEDSSTDLPSLTESYSRSNSIVTSTSAASSTSDRRECYSSYFTLHPEKLYLDSLSIGSASSSTSDIKTSLFG